MKKSIAGFTLLELLVVLAILAVLVTMISQVVATASKSADAVRQTRSQTAREAMAQAWIQGVLRGIVVDGNAGKRELSATETSITGYTTQPLGISGGGVQAFTMRLLDGQASAEYSGGGNVRYVLPLTEAVRFQYRDAAGAMHDKWPPTPPPASAVPPAAVYVKGENVTALVAVRSTTTLPQDPSQALLR
jgi:prepilin-type N-terminal cleavage/methylation domain-containing protein